MNFRAVVGSVAMNSRSRTIKGPGLKLSCDVRRFWKCPACDRSLRLAASRTAAVCHCSGQPKWMKLIEPTPLHSGVRPLPERGSRPAIKDEVPSSSDDSAPVGVDEDASAAMHSATQPAGEAKTQTPFASDADASHAMAPEASSDGSDADESPRKRHDKRRRRPRRSGKRRRKGASGDADAPSGTPDSGDQNS